MDPKIDLDQLPVSSWFPGHMLKAGRRMQERLNLVDMVAELLDARLPATSQNARMRTFFGSKLRSLVFTKADLADPDVSRSWQQWFHERNQRADFIDSTSGTGLDRLVPAWRGMVEQARKKSGATRPLMRPVRIMIVGIPNVGKSTLINRLSASRKAQVGPKPGVTREQQWIALDGGVELLDTPGVLWPKIQSKRMELKLGLAGTLPEELPDPELMVDCLHEWALAHPGCVDVSLYDLAEMPETADALLRAVGRRRGLLKAGGVIDTTQSAMTVINDFRNGRLGRITLDDPR